MKTHAAVALTAIGAALSGCTSNSEEALTREVGGIVRVGMSRNLAKERLQSQGFNCFDTECSRTRTYYLVSTCIQRIYLTLSDQKQVVSRIEVTKPSCAGL